MTVIATSRFFALLALACLALVGGLAVAALGRTRRGLLGSAQDRTFAAVGDSGLTLAWIVAAGSTAGSLYYSEVVGLPPCRLCWYQRIAMFPLVAILGVAAIRRDRWVWVYALPLAVVGGLVAAYQYWLEWQPEGTGGVCGDDLSCGVALFREFGFVSLPFMALAAFAAIAALLTAIAVIDRGDTQ